MDKTALVARINSFPRVRLGQFPTPMELMPRLTQTLGRRSPSGGGPTLWAKRDDFVGLQSNFPRQVGAAARSLGLEPHCFYFAPRPARLEGNLLLLRLVGARLHFIPFGQSDEPTMTIEQTTRLVQWVVRLTPACWGKRVYFIPAGGHTAVGCLGYVLAALEIEEQLRDRGIERATILTAVGTGGTLAGLLAGFRLLNSPHALLGIDVGKLWRAFPPSIAAL